MFCTIHFYVDENFESSNCLCEVKKCLSFVDSVMKSELHRDHKIEVTEILSDTALLLQCLIDFDDCDLELTALITSTVEEWKTFIKCDGNYTSGDDKSQKTFG